MEEEDYDNISPDYLEGESKTREFFARSSVKKAIIFTTAGVLVVAIIIISVILAVFLLPGKPDPYYSSEDEPEVAINYIVILDLGSSGSRVSIFEYTEKTPVGPAPANGKNELIFDDCLLNQLINIIFYM